MHLILVLLSSLAVTFSYDLNQVVFVILSQTGRRHEKIGQETREKLTKVLIDDGVEKPQIFDLHRDWRMTGGWTIFPLLPLLDQVSKPNTKWYAFLNEASEINLPVFKEVLSQYTSDYGIFVGRSLKEHTIDFPDALAGFLMSKELLSNLLVEHNEHKFEILQRVTHDATFFLSVAIKHLASFLENDSRFCTTFEKDCAIYPRNVSCKTSKEAATRIVKQTLFSIRTCKDLHGNRLQIIKKTWEQAAYNMLIASDFEDPGNGTVNLPKGDLDLCHRNLAIIKYFSENAFKNDWKWLIIADDDTMLGVSKMMDLLQCYDEFEDDLIPLGERYGYFVSGPNSRGYNFISGGGGIILNRNVALKLNSGCSCPPPDPMDRMDDVHLGSCLNDLKIPIIHSERLHQRRTQDYDESLLAHQDPVSFHKFIDIDPIKNYESYFKESDEYFRQLKLESIVKRGEL